MILAKELKTIHIDYKETLFSLLFQTETCNHLFYPSSIVNKLTFTLYLDFCFGLRTIKASGFWYNPLSWVLHLFQGCNHFITYCHNGVFHDTKLQHVDDLFKTAEFNPFLHWYPKSTPLHLIRITQPSLSQYYDNFDHFKHNVL